MSGGSEAGQELREAAHRAVKLTWHELTEAAVAYVQAGGETNAHEIERVEGRLRAAAVAYGKAVDQGHQAAAAFRHPQPIRRRPGRRP